MKTLLTFLLCLSSYLCPAQRLISDEHITNQQQRMVFKQWDMDRFTPTPGFLGLNPNYWLTWALHPNYPKTDLRPLGPSGPQTQRIGLVLAMAGTDRAYRLHSDTLKNEAVSKAAGYSGLLSDLDPLWQLYYRKELSPLITGDNTALSGLGEKERSYLISSGTFEWYSGEMQSLAERLDMTRKTTLQRGERLLSYQRLLQEYRSIVAGWSEKKRNAWKYIALSQGSKAVRERNGGILGKAQSDIEIADRILRQSKL